MKNNPSLYFDMWRKKNFKSLIAAYSDTAHNYFTKKEMMLAFGYSLDKFVEGGRGSYSPTSKQWSTAYVLGRELGVFYMKNESGGYNLSPLAQRLLDKEISCEQYLLNYALNFNQLINGRVVHPLKEILLVLADNNGKMTVEDIKNIEKFNLKIKTERNQNQYVNIFLNRLIEAEILKKEKTLYLLDKYKFSELFDSMYVFEGIPSEFEKLSHENYVELLCLPTKLIKFEKVNEQINLDAEINEGLFEFKNNMD